MRACHRQDSVDYPIYYLDPKTEGPGVKWWTRALGDLIHLCGRQKVAQHVAALQYMPYRAREFRHAPVAAPIPAVHFPGTSCGDSTQGRSPRMQGQETMDGGRTGVGSLSLGLRYNKSKAGRNFQWLLPKGLLSRCPGHKQGCLNRKAPDQKTLSGWICRSGPNSTNRVAALAPLSPRPG